MSPLLNAQEIERGLIAAGVPRDKARLEALRQIGESANPAEVPAASSELPPIPWPVRLTLPWSYLVSDNAKYVARIAGTMERPAPKLNLTSDYRRAKGLVRDLAHGRLGDVELAAVPLAFEAEVWVPDELRAHDVCNFAKCVHDALEGVVYTRDRWLYDIHWIRAGVDVDAPRAEITIRPIAA